jgi:hypothetical protein
VSSIDGDQLMKKFVTALVVAAGLGLGAGAASAAPLSATGNQLHVQGQFTPAQYYGGGYGGGGYGYRRHCWYERRCSGYYPYQRCWRERVCR